MRVKDGHFNHYRLIAGYLVFDHLISADTTETDNRLTFDHAELFLLSGMIVIATDDAGLGG